MPKNKYLEIYKKAHNNAVDLLSEAQILFDKKRFARAYALAFTALEEISKSQLAADVYTGFTNEKEFTKLYKDHSGKIELIEWAYKEANLNDIIWLGPNIDDVEQIAPVEALFSKRQTSLYVGIDGTNPKDAIPRDDAIGIIHIVQTALHQILVITEHYGNQIGTKGFLK